MRKPSSNRLSEHAVSPALALRALARDILAGQSRAAPDLTGAVVVLPNLRAAPGLARALSEAAGTVLLLPRMTTLGAWCDGQPAPAQPVSEAAREAALFDALRSRRWFESSDLWPLAGELAALFDDLTRCNVHLPETAQAFAGQLEAAYQARAGEPMQFEARLVHELWRASSQPDAGRMDAVALYHMRLARIAQDAVAPLYAIGLPALTPAEQAFFAAYAQRAPVKIYRVDPGAGDGPAAAKLYAAAWPAPEEEVARGPVTGEAGRLREARPDFEGKRLASPHYVEEVARGPVTGGAGRLREARPDFEGKRLASPHCVEEVAGIRERAQIFAAQYPASPVAGRLALFGASSLEQEARAIETQVRRWLVEGRQRIAVVVLDRMVARRARAMLERAKVAVADETGWIFSTTSASTVIMRWLDALSGDFYHRDLLDLLKSPFIFAGWGERREAVFRLERIIRAESVVTGLDRYLAAARGAGDGVPAVELLERLRRAARGFPRDRRRRLHEWMSLLFGSLAVLDVDEGLRNDPAGVQLLDFLARRSRELAGSDTVFSFGEWRQWLNRQLESAEFRDTGIASPVVFTHLSLTRLREFDACVLVGCDAAHLPGASADTVFFNQSVRGQLGLPTLDHALAQIREDLTGLLSRSATVLVTWQQLRGGEPGLLSPSFERLRVFHQLAWGADLAERELGGLLSAAELPPPPDPPGRAAGLPEVTTQPAPAVRASLIPRQISASGYNSLLACPYQFHARYALKLRQQEEVREALEKRDYGEYVHRILRRFHQRFPVAARVARAELETALNEISEQVFREATEASYLSRAWLLRWQALVREYLDWQLAREAQGWLFHAAELAREIEIALPGGGRLLLQGRIDRVDERTAGGRTAYAVLDYKTRAATALQRALKEAGEDAQLPVYVELLAQPVEEALFLSLDRDEVRNVPLGEDALADSARAVERLRAIFAALYAGAAMPAQGIDAVCKHCEMQGLCRKQYWA